LFDDACVAENIAEGGNCSVNMMDGPGPSSLDIVVGGTGLDVNFGIEWCRIVGGRRKVFTADFEGPPVEGWPFNALSEALTLEGTSMGRACSVDANVPVDTADRTEGRGRLKEWKLRLR
jgi:hypothetical protein